MHLIENGLEELISLSTTELGSLCRELLLLDAASVSKDKMINSVSDAMINNYGDTTNGTLTLIDEDGIDEDAL